MGPARRARLLATARPGVTALHCSVDFIPESTVEPPPASATHRTLRWRCACTRWGQHRAGGAVQVAPPGCTALFAVPNRLIVFALASRKCSEVHKGPWLAAHGHPGRPPSQGAPWQPAGAAGDCCGAVLRPGAQQQVVPARSAPRGGCGGLSRPEARTGGVEAAGRPVAACSSGGSQGSGSRSLGGLGGGSGGDGNGSRAAGPPTPGGEARSQQRQQR